MPIPSDAFVEPAGVFARENAMVCSCAGRPRDRGDLHQLGSRARRKIDRSTRFSSTASWREHLMPNSPKSANRVTRLYSVPSHTLRVDLRDRRDIVHEGLTRAPRLDGVDVRSSSAAMTQPDGQPTAGPWLAILAFFLEGFPFFRAPSSRSPPPLAPPALAVSPPH